jgi:hypothetical protein
MLEKVLNKQILARERAPVTFRIENAATKDLRPIDLEIFAALAKAAITQVSQEQNVLQMDLSNGLSIRVGADDVRIVLNPPAAEVVSTRIMLVREDEEPTASMIERRLWHLRQLYAVLFLVLVQGGKSESLTKGVQREDSNADIDLELLIPSEQRLQVIGAGAGTFWIDVLVPLVKKGYGKVKQTPDAALNALSLLCGEGWRKLMRRVEAGTRAKEADARKRGAEATEAEDAAELKAAENRAKFVIETLNNIHEMRNPQDRKVLHDSFMSSARNMIGPDFDHFLPPPA